MPGNFESSARFGKAPFFVIEADEYDTAFFDKRAKFVHYRPRTAILNNLEYDHADIYPDVASIRRQFNQLLRTVPGAGRLIVNGDDPELATHLERGLLDTAANPSALSGAQPTIGARRSHKDSAASRFRVHCGGREVAEVAWDLIGEHNVMNALAAIAAAHHAGVAPERAVAALYAVSRRQAPHGSARRGRRRDGVRRFRASSHRHRNHAASGLRARVGDARIIAVLEPRSNTMKLGVHREQLAPSLAAADRTWFLNSKDLGWDLKGAVSAHGRARALTARCR